MSQRIDRVRLCLQWVRWLALCGAVGLHSSVDAEVPVITNPSDIHYLQSNTALAPLGPDGWSVLAPMPTGRAGAATVAEGDKIYVFGGEIVDSCDTTSVVEAYDPATDQWITDLAPLPPPTRWRPSAGMLGDLIYIVGGASTGESCGLILDVVQVYDPATNSWSDKPPVPSPRLQIGVGVDPVNNLLYAVGGSTAGPEFRGLKTVEVFDPAANTWTPRHDLNVGRGFPAVAVIGGKVYAIGGQDSHHTAISTTEVYDPPTDTWTILPSIIPLLRLNSAYAVIEDKVYVVGGEASGLLSSLWIYDPSQDCEMCGGQAWTEGISMPTARTFLGVAQVNDTMYAIGGEAAVARVGHPFTYQITATNNPTSFDASPLPDGLIIDHSLGLISGVPTVSDRTFQVTFNAANESGQSVPKQVSFSIEPASTEPPDAPDFLSSTCVTGRAGQPFSFQVRVDNASSNTEIGATGLPYLEGVGPELTIDPGTGFISGTVPATTDGSPQSFGVTVNAADGATTNQSFLEMTFVSDPASPVINSPSSRTLVLNQFFSYTITADAPTDSFSYIGLDGTINGQLPLGLSYDSDTSTISGIYGGGDSPSQTGLAKWINNRSISDPDSIKKEPPPHIQLLADAIGGTGIAPLNFLATIHDFEVEVLSSSSSPGITYVIFSNDPLASGGAAALLESTGSGDFVSYTLPNVAAGTYDVVVGTERGTAQGIFQLSIDGQNQGIPEDEYSSTAAFESRDLGTITFADAGSKTFTFLIVGRNPASIGYQLVVDFIDLIPHPEAEGLVVQANSAPYVNKRDPNLSGGGGTYFKATQVGDYLTYTVPVTVAGRYDISVGATTDKNRGTFELSIDGVNQGYAQNEYAPTKVSRTLDLGTVNFVSAGDKAFTFSVTGKDPNSTDYKLLFDYITLNLSTRLEAEALSARANARLYTLSDQNLSGGTGVVLVATGTGQYVTYTVNIPVAGTYHVKVGVRTADNCGMFQLAVNGRDQGLPQDEYSAVSGYAVLDLGSISFTNPGNKSFRFTVTGKNASSLGYQLSLDYINLAR